MEEADRVEIASAGVVDAGELLTLQRAAYVTEALVYGTIDLPPLTQTLDDLRAELAESYCLKGLAVVGSAMWFRLGMRRRGVRVAFS